MKEKNKQLFNYLENNASKLTEEWLATIYKQSGDKYITVLSDEELQTIKRQNLQFISIIANVFSSGELIDEHNMLSWVEETAKNSAESDSSINEVIYWFKNLRTAYWKKIEQFINETTLEITKEDVSSWTYVFNNAFDTLIEKFVEQFNLQQIRLLQAQQMTIRELSSPVISIVDKIAVLPLVGNIDSHRAQIILETTLNQCNEKNIRHLVIDLSGVPIMDTMVAHQIFKLIDTLKLTGTVTSIAGIRPEIAQTATHLGIDFSQIDTQSTTKKVLNNLLSITLKKQP